MCFGWIGNKLISKVLLWKYWILCDVRDFVYLYIVLYVNIVLMNCKVFFYEFVDDFDSYLSFFYNFQCRFWELVIDENYIFLFIVICSVYFVLSQGDVWYLGMLEVR